MWTMDALALIHVDNGCIPPTHPFYKMLAAKLFQKQPSALPLNDSLLMFFPLLNAIYIGTGQRCIVTTGLTSAVEST